MTVEELKKIIKDIGDDVAVTILIDKKDHIDDSRDVEAINLVIEKYNPDEIYGKQLVIVAS